MSAIDPMFEVASTTAICGRVLHATGAENRARAWTYIGGLAPHPSIRLFVLLPRRPPAGLGRPLRIP